MDEFDHTAVILVAIQQTVADVVRKTAFDLQARAASMAPVDVGFLKNSTYTELHGESNYDEARAEAEALNPNAVMLDEIPPAEDNHTAYVAVGASYGIYLELGTSKMAARPYLVPAADAVRPSFEMAMAELEARLHGLGL